MNYSKKTLIRHVKEGVVICLVGVLFNVLFLNFNPVNIAVSMLIWLALSKGNELIVDLIDQRISWKEQPIFRVIVGIISMLFYTVFAFAVIIIGARWLFEDRNPMEILTSIQLDDFVQAILITLIITLFFHGRAFYKEWKDALYREERLKNETLKTRFEALRNQVNPHFLFNSLNVLSGLVYEDQAKAVEFIHKMSDVYRYVLDKRDQELVPLEDELQFFNSYTFLQKIRFGENLQVTVRKGEEDGYVPPVAMQLLLENAIKHNVVSEARPLHLVVEIDHACIKISNNVQEKLSKDSTGIGLSNLRERYGFLSNKTIEVNNDGKTFEVIIPLLKIDL